MSAGTGRDSCRVSLARALPCPVAGRTAPAPPESTVKTPASGRPRQLDDRDWLSRAYAQDGDMSIALQLGVSRGSVIRARDRLGIPSHGPGRRRGVSSTRPDLLTAFQSGGETGMLMLARFVTESRAGGPAPSDQLLACQIRAYHEAKLHGDQLAEEDALLAIASAAGLIHQHQRRLRRAA